MKFFVSAPTDLYGQNRHSYALQVMGHQVYNFDFRKIANSIGREEMGEELYKQFIAYDPDIFIQIAVGPFSNALQRIKETGVFMLGWWFDYRAVFPQWIADYAEIMHYYGTVVKEWEQYGNNIVFLPQGLNVFDHPRLYPSEFQYDVTFIGGTGGRGYRKKLLLKLYERLQKIDVGLTVFGAPDRWKSCEFFAGESVSGKDFSRVVNSSRINLGIFGLEKQGDRPVGYQSNRIHHSIGSGGFFLTYDTEQLDLLYIPGREVAIYQQKDPYDIDDIYDKIQYYLNDGVKEREVIRERGYFKAVTEHTYEQRFKKIIEMYNNTKHKE